MVTFPKNVHNICLIKFRGSRDTHNTHTVPVEFHGDLAQVLMCILGV